MNRTRVRRRRTALVASLGAVGVLCAGPLRSTAAGSEAAAASDRTTTDVAGTGSLSTSPAAPAGDVRHYVVVVGDTLWSIAVRLGPGGDPRPLVDAIAEMNDVDPGALHPGQTLVIPVA
jgi:nucleoid-associated protein YgaU